MKSPSSIFELPNLPAVYALYGGQSRGMYVAYVGLAKQLKTRIIQHLVRHDSSVTTGVQAVSLNPDYVTQVRWWEHPDFVDSSMLAAAELVAFDLLDPALRSRGTISEQAKRYYNDQGFRSKMRELLEGKPTGYLPIPTLQSTFERIAVLEKRIVEIDHHITELEQKIP